MKMKNYAKKITVSALTHDMRTPLVAMNGSI